MDDGTYFFIACFFAFGIIGGNILKYVAIAIIEKERKNDEF